MTDSPSVPFEGVEKRLVVQFSREVFEQSTSNPTPLPSPYDMTTQEWQTILDEAACSIVSEKRLGTEKVYLLSESTLTVWSTGFLMKTCGRTTPFLALRKYFDLLSLSTNNNGEVPAFSRWVNWMTYSRLDFLHPQHQVWPHQNFPQEVDFLRPFLADANSLRTAVMPAGNHTMHVMHFADPGQKCVRPYMMEEVLMTGIDSGCVRTLTGYDNALEHSSAVSPHCTPSPMRSAVKGRVSELDEFWFNPCGYSSNALVQVDSAVEYFSCHVSPEPITSYASLEVGSSAHRTKVSADGIKFATLLPSFSAQRMNVTRILIGDAETTCFSSVASSLTLGRNSYRCVGAKQTSSETVPESKITILVQHLAFLKVTPHVIRGRKQNVYLTSRPDKARRTTRRRRKRHASPRRLQPSRCNCTVSA